MVKKELVDFLKQAHKLKLSLEAIGHELIKAGYNISDVDDAIRAVKPSKAPSAPLKAPAPPEEAGETEE